MTIIEPQALTSLEAVEEALARNVAEDRSLEEHEALLDRRRQLTLKAARSGKAADELKGWVTEASAKCQLSGLSPKV